MKSRSKYPCFFLGLLIWIFFASNLTSAQSSLGVIWNPPPNELQASDELRTLKSYSTKLIILKEPENPYITAELNRLEIPFIIDTDNQFYTASKFNDQKDAILKQVNRIYSLNHQYGSFLGTLVFSHSQTNNDSFKTILQSLEKLTVFNDSLSFYEYKNNELKNLSEETKTGSFFSPHKPDVAAIYDFNDLIENTSSLLIVEYSWLREIVTNFPNIEHALQNSTTLSDAVIPLPKLPEETPLVHWSIIILLLLWISLAVNVMINPTYKETIFRYFTSHRFFVDDILSYRERSSSSAIFLFFQHAIFGGLVTYVLAKTFITETGLEAFYSYLPGLGILGQNYFSLFMLGSLTVFLIETIAIAWIYIPNPALSHLNQALNLFTWIFHLDFILVTVIIVLFFAGSSTLILSILSLIYIIIWFSSFNTTALDSSKRLGMNRTRYLFKTIALHTLGLAVVVAFLLIFNGWLEVLDLVINI